MGSTRDFVAATLADAMLPLFRRSMEDVVYETLDERQVPSRTDFKDLRDLVNNLRGQVSGTSSGVKRLAEAIEGLNDRLDDLDRRLDQIDARINRSSTGASTTPTNGSARPVSRTCQVPECTADHHSKDFCSRHYQQWRKGALEGFPFPG